MSKLYFICRTVLNTTETLLEVIAPFFAGVPEFQGESASVDSETNIDDMADKIERIFISHLSGVPLG